MPSLKVVGWQERHANTVGFLLRELPPEASISQVEFRRNGELWLQSRPLGAVRFGSLDQRLPRQLEVLAHLAAAAALGSRANPSLGSQRSRTARSWCWCRPSRQKTDTAKYCELHDSGRTCRINF